jgi:hypothetical protein
MSPAWFRAPSNCLENADYCHFCGNLVRPGEIVCEFSSDPFEYLHQSCWDFRLEDSRDEVAA